MVAETRFSSQMCLHLNLSLPYVIWKLSYFISKMRIRIDACEVSGTEDEQCCLLLAISSSVVPVVNLQALCSV